MTSDGEQQKDIRLSVRLTPEERLELETRAGGEHLSAFVRSTLLGKKARPNASSLGKRGIAQALALLGKSDLHGAIRDLSAAARSGAMPADDERIDALNRGLADIAEIKTLLMQALRTKER